MPKDEAEVVSKGKVVPLPAGTIKSAMSAYLNEQGSMKEHQGNLGDVIKNRVVPTGCSAKAFKLAAQMKRMSPEKRADFIRSFDQLVKIFELDNEPDMVDIAEDKPAAKKAAAKKAPAKAATNGNGAKPVDVKSPKNLPENAGVPAKAAPVEAHAGTPALN